MHPRLLKRDGTCTGGSCPAVYDLDDMPGQLVIQGTQAGPSVLDKLTVPRADYENAVIISRDIVLDALRPQDEQVSLDQFEAEFSAFSYTAYRLEQERDYAGSGPDPAWASLVKANRKWGKVHQRTRLVKYPLSAATTEELTEGYPGNVAAGEDIGIITVSGNWPAGVLRDDYWLFDSSRLYVLIYNDNDGTLTMILRVTDPDWILGACKARDAAVHHAVSWRSFIESRPELKRRVAQ